MNRRNFIKSMIAVGMAPAIVKASSIMRINPELYRRAGSCVILINEKDFIATPEYVDPKHIDPEFHNMLKAQGLKRTSNECLMYVGTGNDSYFLYRDGAITLKGLTS